MIEISREEAWDIDEEIDFQIVELLLRQRGAESSDKDIVG
jgi:CMP-N-acetylneuraminic acid synthetase